MTVHVVGNLCRDTLVRVTRFPVPGETLVASSMRADLGGKGLNQATAAARAGASVVLYAAVGREDRAEVEARLAGEERLALRLAGLARPTDLSVILVRADGENLIVSSTECALAFDPLASAAFDAIMAGDILLMQGNLGADATRACLGEARRRAALTIVNPSPLPDRTALAWAEIDLLVLNAGELRALSEELDPRQGIEALRRRGVRAVIATLGREGALHGDGSGWIDIAAPVVEAKDTAGAGDVFCGVLAGAMDRGLGLDEALRRATAAASLSVTRQGALASCPTADELASLSLPACCRSPS